MNDREPDYMDIDEPGVRIVCPHCREDAFAIKRDFGIGRDEAYGRPIVHVDMRWCCCECGDCI